MLIPALDLIDGQVVRLHKGQFNEQTTYHTNAVEVAKSYQQAGATWIHLVDLDGARDPKKRQLELIKRIHQESNLRVQTGGGIREKADLVDLFNSGVERAVIGSLAVTQPELVASWLEEFGGEQIVLALDVNIDEHGRKFLATHGWQQQSNVELEACIERYLPYGIKHVLCTDISRDGTLSGSHVALYQSLKQEFSDIVWQASGGVASLNDLHHLKDANCDSVILGKALLTGQFTLQEALACWQNA